MVLIIGIFLLLSLLGYLGTKSFRDAILQSYLILACMILVITEIFSLANMITRSGILISWILLAVGLILMLIWKTRGQAGPILESVKRRFAGRKRFSGFEIFILISISGILLLTLVIALAAPPNNFDSMTYHMPRIVHWIQQKSVEFYPTSIARQNHSMPMAEYMILHLQLLTRSDRFANLIQWSGFLVLIIAVSDSARLLGASRRGQLSAGLFTATLPMAILQSSSTQNDLITSLFCILFANYLIRLLQTRSWTAVILAGLSLGLGLITKGTAYLFCAAIGLAFSLAFLVAKEIQLKARLVFQLGLVVLVGLTLNMGFYARNQSLYSNPLSTETNRVIVDNISAGGLYANLVRNGSMHLAVPNPSRNQQLTGLISTHLGNLVSDPGNTYAGSDFEIRYLINEDESGNLLHFLIIFLALVKIPVNWKTGDQLQRIWAIAVILAVILFSGLLKWQPWGSRLQLPIFALGAPLAGSLIHKTRKTKLLPLVLSVLLIVYSLPFLFLNASRPLVPLFKENSRFGPILVKRFFSNRPNLYDEYATIISPYYKGISVLSTDRTVLLFAANSSLQEDYQTIIDQVNLLDISWVGLQLGSNDWEYPIWVLTDRVGGEGKPAFYHIGVADTSRELDPSIDPGPEYIISTRIPPILDVDGIKYDLVIDTPSIDLLKKR